MKLRHLLLAAALASPLYAQPVQNHWVSTWTASPVGRDPANKIGAQDTTLREIIHITLGGTALRIRLSNEMGTDPLRIQQVHLALSAGASTIKLPSAHQVTFSGRPTVTIPNGAAVISDPIYLSTTPNSDLAISIFIPAQPLHTITTHPLANQTSYLQPGNVIEDKALPAAKEIYTWDFLTAVDVDTIPPAPAKPISTAATIVAFGDSITDGAHITRNGNGRWPNLLFNRLQASKKTQNLAVANAGISGNRLLHDVSGPSALARFDRDVLALPNVKYLLILEGVNDIGHNFTHQPPGEEVAVADLIAAITQLAQRAHVHNIKVYAATLTPYEGAKYWGPDGEKDRQTFNTFIRTSPAFDAFIDFDKATQDPAHPNAFLPPYDSGDHLHPQDAGYKAMADSIDLKLFEK